MEINDFNHFPFISICQNASVDTPVSGCDGGPLKTEAIIVLHPNRHYTDRDWEGTTIAI